MMVTCMVCSLIFFYTFSTLSRHNFGVLSCSSQLEGLFGHKTTGTLEHWIAVSIITTSPPIPDLCPAAPACPTLLWLPPALRQVLCPALWLLMGASANIFNIHVWSSPPQNKWKILEDMNILLQFQRSPEVSINQQKARCYCIVPNILLKQTMILGHFINSKKQNFTFEIFWKLKFA